MSKIDEIINDLEYKDGFRKLTEEEAIVKLKEFFLELIKSSKHKRELIKKVEEL